MINQILNSNKVRGRFDLAKWVTLLAVLIVLISGWLIVQPTFKAAELEQSRRFSEEYANGLATRVTGKIYTATNLANSVAAVLAVSPDVLAERYDEVVGQLVGARTQIENVFIAPNLVISQVFPTDGNESLLGLDLIESSGSNSGTLNRSITDKEPVLIGPFDRPTHGTSAFASVTPVFSDVEQTEFWGIVGIVFSADEFFASTGLTEATSDFDVAVRNLDFATGALVPVFGDQSIFTSNAIARELELPGTTWEIAIQPKGGWAQVVRTGVQREFLTYLAFSAIILGLVWHSLHHRDARQTAEALMSDAINALDDGFVIYDATDRFVACNNAYRKFYADSSDLFVPGTPFRKIVTEGARRGQYADAIGREDEWIEERMKAHLNCQDMAVQQLADGRWLKISERRTVGGAIVGFRVDITELTEARETAESAYRAKSEFISVLSHELRTPLTIILGYAKVLANLHRFKDVQDVEKALNEEVIDGAKVSASVTELVRKTTDQAVKMEKSGNHLLTLINDLLDYSKIEAGHFTLSKEMVSLKSIVNSVVEDMSDFAFSRDLLLKDCTRDVQVEADPIRLKQVFINLINNAIKFTKSGEIRVETEILNDSVEISVVDTGCGIDRDKLEDIFAAFQQADLSDRRNAGGTGLGLAISRRIVQLHDGELRVDSTLGEGSRFTARLPLSEVRTVRSRRTLSARLLSEDVA